MAFVHYIGITIQAYINQLGKHRIKGSIYHIEVTIQA